MRGSCRWLGACGTGLRIALSAHRRQAASFASTPRRSLSDGPPRCDHLGVFTHCVRVLPRYCGEHNLNFDAMLRIGAACSNAIIDDDVVTLRRRLPLSVVQVSASRGKDSQLAPGVLSDPHAHSSSSRSAIRCCFHSMSHAPFLRLPSPPPLPSTCLGPRWDGTVGSNSGFWTRAGIATSPLPRPSKRPLPLRIKAPPC